jgi:ABC-2 type transport system permease protein
MVDVFVSEWTKTRSVKSTYVLLAVAAVTAVGGSAILALSERGSSKPGRFDPVASVFLGWIEYPILALGILGALSFSSEYTTGQIRTTLAAVPQRLTVLAAKAGVTGMVALVFGEALAFASFVVYEAILAGRHGSTALSHPGVPGELLAAGLTLFAIATLGLALGAVIRHTAGAVAAIPALVYLPLVTLSLPHPWNDDIGKFTLLAASYQLVSEHPHDGLLSRPLSLAVVLTWPAVALVIAGVLIERRDA